MTAEPITPMDRSANVPPLNCPCGTPATALGKLPEIGLHPLIYVYWCKPCSEIIEIAPGRCE
jgi:hypothetical protein